MIKEIYSLSQNGNMDKVMNELVIKPYLNQKNNLAWQQQVISQSGNHHRQNILKQGKADFSQAINGLNPEQTTLLYTYTYGPMHMSSGKYLLDMCQQNRNGNLDLLKHNSIIVDFGCGPLTFGLSLAWHNLEVNHRQLKLNYIGIDRAQAMLDKAEQFSQQQVLFTGDSQFSFLTDYTNYAFIKNAVQKYTKASSKNGILLNFSYFFASDSLNVSKLLNVVNQLLIDFPYHRFSILFQNPINPYLNQKWQQFKGQLGSNFRVVTTSETEVRYYTYDIQSFDGLRQPSPIKLYYEVLIN